jgi:hypothetical protein
MRCVSRHARQRDRHLGSQRAIDYAPRRNPMNSRSSEIRAEPLPFRSLALAILLYVLFLVLPAT